MCGFGSDLKSAGLEKRNLRGVVHRHSERVALVQPKGESIAADEGRRVVGCVRLPPLHEAELFEGAENRLTMNQTYTWEFQCQYELANYPFDAQVTDSL